MARKTYAVEKRPCGDCKNHKQLFDGGICKKHLMAMYRGSFVTYKVKDGTCFEPRPKAAEGRKESSK